MDVNQLEDIASQDESDVLEFKRSTGQLKRAMITLCGFLNAHGGKVLIGIDGGRIVGQQVGDCTLQDLATHLRKFDPPAPIAIERIAMKNSDREVLVLSADPSWETRPFTYDDRPYHRIETTTSVMPQERYQQLLLDRSHSHRRWENAPAPDVMLKDLDGEEILRTIRISIENRRIPESTRPDPGEFLDELRLRVGDEILNAAVVLFGKQFLPDFPQCELRMARFAGRDKTEFLDDRQIRGHIFHLLEEAMLFLTRHLPVAGRIGSDSLVRTDEPLFPTAALREALVNAFCHRDYSIHGGCVSLAIYDDRLEIWSDGPLPFGLKVEDLRTDHLSRPTNPIIADVLYRRGLVERWGRGTQRIIELCLNAGHPEPEFVERGGAVGVLFIPRGYVAPHRVALDLTPRQREILEIIASEDEIPLRRIMERMASPPAQTTVRDDIYHMKRLGLITSKGHGRSAVWSLVMEYSRGPE